MGMKISVGIVGVRGYVGAELLRILLRHPEVEIRYLASRQLDRPMAVGDLLPAFSSQRNLKVYPFRLEDALGKCELLFLALPPGLSMELTPRILRKKGTRVIDLSADFRLRRQAVYGLTEYARDLLPSTRLVANPGCYSTAVLLGILPLAQEGLVGKEGFIADAKSGVTGAGRGLKEELLFCEVNEDLRAYRVNTHQHIPEMEEALTLLARRRIRMVFVPHLVPLNRGLYATIYAPLAKRFTQKRMRALFEKRYGEEPFIRLLPEGKVPQVKSVAGTNVCEIGLAWDSKKNLAILLVAIDNLGKGAAGQAVQNMNLLYGLDERGGLTP
jgi:N-acetyl-gamma-glutamyl-phosphate reductase